MRKLLGKSFMHDQFLQLALAQAQLGRGSCAPNPSVGAVAVQNGHIIAQAWHKGAGLAHAETLVLAQFPPQTPGVSLYITLEPCNHWGKTPPCVEAIIRHGIKEVIYAYPDPNPLVVEKNSVATLSAHGIKVHLHRLPAIDAFYQSYAHWLTTKKPFVTVKMAQSLDGKITGAQSSRVKLSNALCDEFTHNARAEADVILTTARTINQDDPLLTVRRQGSSSGKPLAIIDRTLSLNLNAQALLASTQNLIYHDELRSANPSTLAEYHPICSNDGVLDLESILLHLGKLGFHDCFVEAGGGLFTALHQQQLVGRTYIYIVPRFLGVDASGGFQSHTPYSKPPRALRWETMDDNMIVCMDW